MTIFLDFVYNSLATSVLYFIVKLVGHHVMVSHKSNDSNELPHGSMSSRSNFITKEFVGNKAMQIGCWKVTQ